MDRYEVALSFAGEQRDYVREVGRHLQARGVAVFYDEFEEVRLWGMNLAEELHRIYELATGCVVMFVSIEYVEKPWTKHERRSTLSAAVNAGDGYVLPVRFDDVVVPGLPGDVVYQDARVRTPAEIAIMVCAKLGFDALGVKASDVPAPASTALSGEVVFDYSNHNGSYEIGREPGRFETRWSKASNESVHIYNYPKSIHGIAVAKGCKTISDIKSAEGLDFTSSSRTPRIGEVVILQNTNGLYAALEILRIKDDTRGDDQDELCFRYAIQADGSCDFSAFV